MWQVEPVDIVAARSSFLDDADRFPPGTAALDCALLMRDVPVTWNPLPPMRVSRDGDRAAARRGAGRAAEG